MTEEAVNIIPKDILGVPLEVGDCVAIAGANRGALIVGNITKIVTRKQERWVEHYIDITTQAGRKVTRYGGCAVAFISRNPSA